ncbi:MAG: putative Small GTP-binding domain protein [Promethearchaeota archaeon]|jgi:small GTP-binding protein|nr:MAG: putative Small GTP-binding domain protein [Candidatus Lokiarchaeota archaeon]
MLRNKLYKICIIGDGAVGKTTILHRYVEGEFLENTKMTIGTNFYIKDLIFEDLKANIKLQIWDLSGQTHFSSVRPGFYKGAKGIIYAFDLTRMSTFKNLIKWQKEVNKALDKNPPSVLIGNKLDLIEKKGAINPKDIKEINNQLDYLAYFKTSAKDNVGIQKAFEQLARDIFNYYQEKTIS